MLITNNYLRKLIWGLGFALFCVLLAVLYSLMTQKNNAVEIRMGRSGRKKISIPDLIMFLIMTVFASVRLNVGSDYYNYYIRFNDISKEMSPVNDIFNSLNGYRWLSYIVKQITDYEYAIFAVIAIVLYCFVFKLLKDEVQDKAAGLACYLFMGFFANSLNILRQCIAMMFVMAFYKMLREKKIVQCIIFAFLAFSFHYSALFVLVIIGFFSIVKIKPSRRLLLISIGIGIVFSFFLPQIIRLMIRYVPSASGYEVYVNWRRNNQIRLMIAVAGMSLVYAMLICIILKNKYLIKKQSKARYYEISFLIIGLCINIASIRIWVVQRIALYFYQFIILIIPTMFQGMNPSKKNKTKQWVYFIMILYLIFAGIFLGENEYYSYNTVFSDDKPMYDADYNKMFN